MIVHVTSRQAGKTMAMMRWACEDENRVIVCLNDTAADELRKMVRVYFDGEHITSMLKPHQITTWDYLRRGDHTRQTRGRVRPVYGIDDLDVLLGRLLHLDGPIERVSMTGETP